MDEIKEKLRKLKERRKLTSHANFKEVLEENQKSKRPANWDKRQEKNVKKIEEAEAKQKAEELGEDYEVKKSLNYQADEIEKWDRIKASKKRLESGFVDFEEATKRQYGRLTKQLKPDVEAYNSLKEEIGEKNFYLTEGSSRDEASATTAKPKTALIKDSKEGVERMVEDVHKQIEIRSKRSRRRKYDDDADVDYINERNSKFNKKLDRFYGEYTEEIKQNFERGTAI